MWKGEIKNKAKDGTFYWVDTTIVPYLGEDGKPVQYIAIRADITERKKAEAALQKAQDELQDHASTLEETVEARTAALARNDRRTGGVFLQRLSRHARAVAGHAKLLENPRRGLRGCRSVPKGKEYLRRISTAAARMDSLIQDVLTYSRVSRTDLPLQPVDVGTMLREIIETYPTFQAARRRKWNCKGEFPDGDGAFPRC